mmetsp:Transcript_15521/g.45812  ORF Transcript_15521/g.45812 Transcript_15521/m.45812 type:complete len:598 (-) Transcript_15521:1558-3351(-)
MERQGALDPQDPMLTSGQGAATFMQPRTPAAWHSSATWLPGSSMFTLGSQQPMQSVQPQPMYVDVQQARAASDGAAHGFVGVLPGHAQVIGPAGSMDMSRPMPEYRSAWRDRLQHASMPLPDSMRLLAEHPAMLQYSGQYNSHALLLQSLSSVPPLHTGPHSGPLSSMLLGGGVEPHGGFDMHTGLHSHGHFGGVAWGAPSSMPQPGYPLRCAASEPLYGVQHVGSSASLHSGTPPGSPHSQQALGSSLLRENSGGVAAGALRCSSRHTVGGKRACTLQPSSSGGTPGRSQPLKDTTQRKNMLIKQLQAELAEKASLVAKLEEDREQLLSRERLLQLQVRSSDRAIKVLSDSAVGLQLHQLLTSFRTSVSNAAASQLMSQLPDGATVGQIGLRNVALIWKTWVGEMSAVLAEEQAQDGQQDAFERINELSERVQDFLMACGMQQPMLMLQAACTRMDTCEDFVRPQVEWRDIVEELRLSTAQRADLSKVYDLYRHTLGAAASEQRAMTVKLLGCVDHGIRERVAAAGVDMVLRGGEAPEEGAIDALVRARRRMCLLHVVVDNLALSLLAPRQRLQLCVLAFPSLPDPKLMLPALFDN